LPREGGTGRGPGKVFDVGTEFLGSQLWRRITKLARKGQGDVAVAYFARGARKLLPLKRGTRLVVDASERSVKSGQTDPNELLYFINRGVAVHSVENLHAKVFVFGKTAVVGSMNVSRRSADLLQEAGVLTTDPALVAEARGFVESQMGEEVTAEHARQLKKLWKPPHVGGGGRRQRKQVFPLHQPLWVVPLTITMWDTDEKREAELERPVAATRIRRKLEKLDEFSWDGYFCERLKKRHLVMQFMKRGRRIWVLQAAHVVAIRRFRGARGKRRMIVFLAIPRSSRRMSIADVRGALPRHGHLLPKGWRERLVRAPEAAHALLNLWAHGTAR
jgi:hypothetical protein